MPSAPTNQPTIFVLFGATGDLARRLVLPSVFQLYAGGMLPDRFKLIGVGRSIATTEALIARAKAGVDEFGSVSSADPAWDGFAASITHVPSEFTVDSPGALPDTIAAARLELSPDDPASVQVVYYLALPPVLFGAFTRALGAHGLAPDARVIYEKPFGTSPEAFAELNTIVDATFDEDQVYRIDHFLGKEATQNLHVTRFANATFAGSWDRHSVDHVIIDVPETLNVADRAEFYDATGATLDMLVSHLLQVAAEVAMEPPATMGAADLQAARTAATAHFRPLDPAEVVLGQFDGYRELAKIDPNSTTDTFAAARLWIDNERWRGVPFILRTGKMLGVSAQHVNIVFRGATGPLTATTCPTTVLTFDLAGNGAVDLRFAVKRPGPGLTVAPGTARLALDTVSTPDVTTDDGSANPSAAAAAVTALTPYARLIGDFLHGDRSLFAGIDSLANTWSVVAPLLANRPTPLPYAPGSMGPAAADALVPGGAWA